MNLVESLITSFLLVTITELGDKTQLTSIALSANSPKPLQTFLGIIVGLTMVTIFGTLAGTVMALYIPIQIIQVVGGAIFLIIGSYLILKYIRLNQTNIISEDQQNMDYKTPFFKAFTVIFLMEMGDKTQITVIILTALSYHPLFVLIGGICALLLVNSIGVLLGNKISKYFSYRRTAIFSGFLFILIGVWTFITMIFG
jgi:putative Ca2+/H+ antiporter (TMEM165/GDT1 family)